MRWDLIYRLPPALALRACGRVGGIWRDYVDLSKARLCRLRADARNCFQRLLYFADAPATGHSAYFQNFSVHDEPL